MLVAAAQLNIKCFFQSQCRQLLGILTGGRMITTPYSCSLSQYLSHLQNWKSKLKDRNEKRLHSSHSKFDVKQYWNELAHKCAILIEKQGNVQFRLALPFLIFFSLRSSKVKYCFPAEIIKRPQRATSILPFVHENSDEARGLSGGLIVEQGGKINCMGSRM